MSVEESHLFELINFASFENGHKLSSSAFSESKNFIYGFVILDNKKLNFCHLPKHRKEVNSKATEKNDIQGNVRA